MPFHFALQPVLRLRAIHERIERLRLLELAATVARVREEMSALETESSNARQRMRDALSLGVTGIEMHLESVSETNRSERRTALDARLAGLERKQEKQRRTYLEARRKREILENLRERHLEQYRREQARRDQQAADELYLLRRGANPSESE